MFTRSCVTVWLSAATSYATLNSNHHAAAFSPLLSTPSASHRRAIHAHYSGTCYLSTTIHLIPVRSYNMTVDSGTCCRNPWATIQYYWYQFYHPKTHGQLSRHIYGLPPSRKESHSGRGWHLPHAWYASLHIYWYATDSDLLLQYCLPDIVVSPWYIPECIFVGRYLLLHIICNVCTTPCTQNLCVV